MPREMTLADLLRVDRVACWDYDDRQAILGPPGGSRCITVATPQLKHLNVGKVFCHRLVAPMFLRALELIEQLDLLGTFISYAGCYNYRPSAAGGALSTHAWGAAFDFNAAWNGFGKRPAPLGEKGTLLPVVGIWQACGFAWGGHYRTPDGMHFEPFEIRGADRLPVLAEATADKDLKTWCKGAVDSPLGALYAAASVCPDKSIGHQMTADLNVLNRNLIAAGVKGDG